MLSKTFLERKGVPPVLPPHDMTRSVAGDWSPGLKIKFKVITCDRNEDIANTTPKSDVWLTVHLNSVWTRKTN